MAGIEAVEGSDGIRGASGKAEVGRKENVVAEVRMTLCRRRSLCLGGGGLRLDMVLRHAGSRLREGSARMDRELVAWSDVRDSRTVGNGHYSRNLG